MKIAEIMWLMPSILDYYDVSGAGAGGVWYPTLELCPRHRVTPKNNLSFSS